MHHQRDDGEASEALRKAKFVLVRQDRHKPLLVEAYRGPFIYKIKSGDNSYLLVGSNAKEGQVAINRLKTFHIREGEEEIDLQLRRE